jgi:hypothetical protein
MTQNYIFQNEPRSSVQKAWVVFSGKTEMKRLKILKSGFRHCFVIINDGKRWMSVDPLSPYTDIEIHHQIKCDFDLPAWFRHQQFMVVPSTMQRDHQKPAPIGLFTCVETVKRLLGIHCFYICTPWQLFRYLQKTNLKTTKGD